MTTSVAEKSDAVLAMTEDWTLATALLGGTRTMRAAGATYLPRWPKEPPEAWDLRRNTAVLFPAYQRTINTLAAKPFSKPLTINEDVPARFLPWLRDIDLQGRDLNAFAPDALTGALGYGLAGILIEYPTKSDAVRTLAQEQAAGLRPYWVEVNATQILGWRSQRVGGMWKLTQLRIAEVIEEYEGDYGTVSVEQVRVLSPGAWETHRMNEKGVWTLYEQGVTTLNEVPFVPIYAGRYGFMQVKPPLIEVAHLNVAHWQSASDQQTILHVARVPILTVTGVDDEAFKLEVGASAAIKLPEGSEMRYVEHSGAAIGAGVTELEKIEERMRQAGAELLVLAPRMTATQVMTENVVGLSLLQRITLTYQDALNQALAITARWVGQPAGGTVTLFNDYGVATLQEASAQLLLQTNQAGKLSDETLHSEYQRRGILDAATSWEDEQARLETQGPALDTMTQQSMQATPAAPPSAPEQAFDMGALIAAIGSITFPAPIVNVAAPAAAAPPQITVEAPTINVTVPEQQPPVVNIAPAAITVESPTINMPAITVNVPEQAAPAVTVSPPNVTVNSPPVNVTIEKGGAVKFTEDDDGNITGAVMQ